MAMLIFFIILMSSLIFVKTSEELVAPNGEERNEPLNVNIFLGPLKAYKYNATVHRCDAQEAVSSYFNIKKSGPKAEIIDLVVPEDIPWNNTVYIYLQDYGNVAYERSQELVFDQANMLCAILRGDCTKEKTLVYELLTNGIFPPGTTCKIPQGSYNLRDDFTIEFVEYGTKPICGERGYTDRTMQLYMIDNFQYFPSSGWSMYFCFNAYIGNSKECPEIMKTD